MVYRGGNGDRSLPRPFFYPQMPVSDANIHALKPKDKVYKTSLGEGLYVQVWPEGKKYWRIKYRFEGRERLYSVGVFPKVSVAAAFAARLHIKNILRDGTDPAVAKRQAAKLNPKSISKNVFRLALSLNGALTLETEAKLLTLTSPSGNAPHCRRW